ncbi:hypothetical protein [Blastococcus sp. PRF04-17]|uniref:hypothetical protein n=1 Tax=Blastococcus sp. PRF04-17 TaxID=2933797 RepID=UPI001FF37A99|nr:hypothetical protein [Blastococcus sp. PRF04-17]UOY01742.1 hypothetical protein MVA48_22950 [Blastococcus sp. PRF04-17]
MTTTTDPVTPAAGAATAELKPGARFRRVGGALSLLGAGTLTFVSLLMIPYENQTHAEYLQTGVDHTTNILWAAVVLHFGYLLLVPAAFTLVRLARRTAPKLSMTAMVLAGLGSGLSGIIVVDFYDVALANSLPADQALEIWNLAGSYGQGAIIAASSVLGMALGINLAVFAAWRARAIPVYPLVLNVVGWAVFTLFSGDAWLPSIGTGLVAIGLAWAGVIVLRTRDEVWDRL